MDPRLVSEILHYKMIQKYPPGATKSEKLAANFQLKSKAK